MTAVSGAAPLAGITVLDMTEGVAGPYASSLLGDLGADVIKIERPQGDWGRVTGAMIEPEFGSIFVAMNRNKRCLGLDVRTEHGRKVVGRILERADVVISNYRRGVMERLGLGYDDCVAVRPNIVYCTISAFDPHSQWAGAPGNDTALQAASGLMSLVGMPDGEPLRVAVPVIDFTAGVFAAQGVLAGLVRRDAPRLVEVSLISVAAALQGIPLTEYLKSGVVPDRHGNQNPYIAPAGAYVARDGKFLTVACLRQTHWEGLCAVLERDDLVADPRFADNTARVANRPELNIELDKVFQTRDQHDWLTLLTGAGVLHSAVSDLSEVLANPGTGPTLPITTAAITGAGPARTIGNPLRINHSFPATQLAPPRRGEHSVELLTEFGYTETEIRELVDAAVVAVSSTSPDA
jgi:crotonobetainyl-CoA:carnitine CoA-transferase CaiB-like acyl-CoA transferase